MTQLSHSLKNRLDAIGEKLLVLREKDRQHKLFGASRHGYVLGPTMSEMQLAAICTPLGLKLPEEYAAFISYVGDGGPGPDYGLYPLAESLRRCGVRDWAADFPYEEAWQPLFGGETWSSLEAAGLLHDHMNTPVPPEQQAAYREWEDEYSDSVHTQGTLPISDGGCGHVTLLIVGGTQRGSIWSDSRVSDAGLVPMAQTFLDWYETWLHHALDELKGPS